MSTLDGVGPQAIRLAMLGEFTRSTNLLVLNDVDTRVITRFAAAADFGRRARAVRVVVLLVQSRRPARPRRTEHPADRIRAGFCLSERRRSPGGTTSSRSGASWERACRSADLPCRRRFRVGSTPLHPRDYGQRSTRRCALTSPSATTSIMRRSSSIRSTLRVGHRGVHVRARGRDRPDPLCAGTGRGRFRRTESLRLSPFVEYHRGDR